MNAFATGAGRILRLTPSVILIGTMVLGAGKAAASGAPPEGCGSEWQVVASPSPGSLANSLSRVAAPSQNDAWAVGMQISDPHGAISTRPLVEHWDGASWTEVSTPGTFRGNLTGLYAAGPDDIFAVGSKFHGLTESLPVAEHWDGSAWTIIQTPKIQFGNMLAVGGTSDVDVWAVGTIRDNHPRMLLAHYDGSMWTVTEPPRISSPFVALSAVDALSPTDVWAAGSYLGDDQMDKPLVVHYDGTAWSVVALPHPGNGDASLLDISAVNAGNIWVVGTASNGNVDRTLAMQSNGSTFRIVKTPNMGGGDNSLSGVATTPDGAVQAVGSFMAPGGTSRTLTESYTDSAWSILPSQNVGADNVLSAIAIGPDGGMWAVGNHDGHGEGKTLIERLCP